MNLDELEAQAIASRFDRGQLAVYADALQSSRDSTDQLRGELIALDLHVGGPTPELDQRRHELLANWLGELVPHVRCEWGFLHLSLDITLPVEHLFAKLLSSPAAAWLRGLELYGEPEYLRDAVSLLSMTPRRRLAALAVIQPYSRDNVTIAGRAATNLIQATPALTTLVVRGNGVFGAFPHPAIRRIRVAGWNAVGSLAGEGAPLPALEQLDLAMHADFRLSSWGGSSVQQRQRMLRGVPSLRRLDLSRNEPAENPYGQPVSIFGFLRELAIKRRLTHLRVPAIALPEQLAALQYTLDHMPELVELEVTGLAPRNILPDAPPTPGARRGGVGEAPLLMQPPFKLALFHPATIILPNVSDWIPRTHGRGRDALAIEIPDHPHRLTVELLDGVKHLELDCRKLRAPTREAWDRLWATLDRLGWDPSPFYTPAPAAPGAPPAPPPQIGTPQRAELSAAVLAECCAAMTEPRWRTVHTAITARRLPADATVRVRRLWSYD